MQAFVKAARDERVRVGEGAVHRAVALQEHAQFGTGALGRERDSQTAFGERVPQLDAQRVGPARDGAHDPRVAPGRLRQRLARALVCHGEGGVGGMKLDRDPAAAERAGRGRGAAA
mgnify:CR=1 FL=1